MSTPPRSTCTSLFLLAALLVSAPASAGPRKGKGKEPAAPTADDFLGDMGGTPRKGGGSEDLEAAAGGMKQKSGSEDLAPRVDVTARDQSVKLKQVFISNKIMITGTGCVPPGGKAQLATLNAADLPFIVQAFAVCARLESGRGRAVPVTFKIVTPKGRVVGTSENIVDFGAKQMVDVVVDFPDLKFPVDGVYKYRMEVEGVMVGQVDLLDLKFTGAQRPDIEELGQ